MNKKDIKNRRLKNEWDKNCFKHDMASRANKNLPRRTVSVRVLQDKPFETARDLKDDVSTRASFSVLQVLR